MLVVTPAKIAKIFGEKNIQQMKLALLSYLFLTRFRDRDTARPCLPRRLPSRVTLPLGLCMSWCVVYPHTDTSYPLPSTPFD
jgi:hypothetical protein